MSGTRDEALHPIGVAAERAGITPDVIRAWERRYGVVEPARDDAGRRVYTSADVRRLRLLSRATEAGRSIGQVVGLGTEELEALVREDEAARRSAAPRVQLPDDAVEVVSAAMDHVRSMDAPALESLLLRAASLHGIPALLRGILAPLFRAIGDAWHGGRLTPAQEHVASAAVRGVLGRLLGTVPVQGDAPVLIVGTPAGERHEIGALLVTAAATLEGWRVVYLGADLPADEIAAAVERTGARGVALSAIYAPQPEALTAEVRRLRELLPSPIRVMVGGGAAASLNGSLGREAGILRLNDLDELRAHLRAVAPA